MANKHEGIVGRSDVYRINPFYIKTTEGWNPRKDFGDEKDEELKNSIIENGVKLPLRVKKNEAGNFDLIDGERRWRATLKAIEEGHEIESIPCYIERKTINQIDALVTALISNEGKPLAPSEEAEAYRRLKNWGLTYKQIAQKVGKSPHHCYHRLKLADAAPDLKKSIDSKEVTLGEAEEIVKESEGDINAQIQGIERKIQEKRQREAEGAQRKAEGKSKRKPKKSIDLEEAEALLQENVNAFNSSEDPYFKQFAGGIIRGLCLVLEREEPVELDY